MKQHVFEKADLCFVFDRIGPNPCDVPNVDLTIRNHALVECKWRFTRERMPSTDVDRNLIEVAEYIAADFLG
jgi:hypothetical protein